VAKRGPCAVARCERPRKIRGWCWPHYQRWRRWGDPEATAIRTWSPAKLPLDPLLEFLKGRQLPHSVLQEPYPNAYRQIGRSRLISEADADRIACELLAVHPVSIWPDWYEVTAVEGEVLDEVSA
jgi:hypothetical protein